ncbi:hypothetical protein BLNAU_22207 [Blattamonas nauphoetae]|uniref:Uncharacterized protein n=1 Tax=Blattamonas nauphoetae TaxID=2049346 RepID=A0ABQ9WTP0_9EUKA|nr:hypothetical protein BLNAU_22207 [Blattamonas nauphoetae]
MRRTTYHFIAAPEGLLTSLWNLVSRNKWQIKHKYIQRRRKKTQLDADQKPHRVSIDGICHGPPNGAFTGLVQHCPLLLFPFTSSTLSHSTLFSTNASTTHFCLSSLILHLRLLIASSVFDVEPSCVLAVISSDHPTLGSLHAVFEANKSYPNSIDQRNLPSSLESKNQQFGKAMNMKLNRMMLLKSQLVEGALKLFDQSLVEEMNTLSVFFIRRITASFSSSHAKLHCELVAFRLSYDLNTLAPSDAFTPLSVFSHLLPSDQPCPLCERIQPEFDTDRFKTENKLSGAEWAKDENEDIEKERAESVRSHPLVVWERVILNIESKECLFLPSTITRDVNLESSFSFSSDDDNFSMLDDDDAVSDSDQDDSDDRKDGEGNVRKFALHLTLLHFFVFIHIHLLLPIQSHLLYSFLTPLISPLLLSLPLTAKNPRQIVPSACSSAKLNRQMGSTPGSGQKTIDLSRLGQSTFVVTDEVEEEETSEHLTSGDDSDDLSSRSSASSNASSNWSILSTHEANPDEPQLPTTVDFDSFEQIGEQHPNLTNGSLRGTQWGECRDDWRSDDILSLFSFFPLSGVHNSVDVFTNSILPRQTMSQLLQLLFFDQEQPAPLPLSLDFHRDHN